MAHIFEITASPEKAVALNTSGTGEVAFTVTNVTGAAVKGRAVLGPEQSPALSWLKLVGEPERLIQPKLSDTFVVKVGVPPGTKPGDYSFRLDAISVSRPDEDSTQGPTIGVPVTLAPSAPRSFPWWILVVVAVVMGVLSYAALKLIPNTPAPVNTDVSVPDLSNKNVSDGGALLLTQHLKLGTVDDLVVTDVSKVDLILHQTPAPPSKVPPGTNINVQIGVAIVTVPTVKGGPLDAAQKAIHEAHLEVGEITPVNELGVMTPGQVINSTPAEGNTVRSHTKIALTVQKGTVAVPDLTGMTLPGAILLLMEKNLKFGALTGLPLDTYMVGERAFFKLVPLSDWSPKGQSVPIGSAIDLVFPVEDASKLRPGDRLADIGAMRKLFEGMAVNDLKEFQTRFGGRGGPVVDGRGGR